MCVLADVEGAAAEDVFEGLRLETLLLTIFGFEGDYSVDILPTK